MSKILLIVDTGCDLPSAFLSKYKIKSLSGLIKMKSPDGDITEYEDTRSENFTCLLYQQKSFDTSNDIQTDIPEVSVIASRLEQMTKGFDQAIIQVISRTTSPAFERINQAVSTLKNDCKVKVLDSKTAFSGQGLLAAYTQAQMLSAEKAKISLDVSQLRRIVERFSGQIYTHVVPSSVSHLYQRARGKRVESSLTWSRATIAKMLDVYPIIQFRLDLQDSVDKARKNHNAIEKMAKNLMLRIEANELIFNYIVISIASAETNDLDKFDSIIKLENLCIENKIKVIKSRMSNAGTINLGPGTIAISYAAKKHEFGIESPVARQVNAETA